MLSISEIIANKLVFVCSRFYKRLNFCVKLTKTESSFLKFSKTTSGGVLGLIRLKCFNQYGDRTNWTDITSIFETVCYLLVLPMCMFIACYAQKQNHAFVWQMQTVEARLCFCEKIF